MRLSFKQHHGFTLAEILIACVIIGVLAVMTVPSIIDNWHKTFYLSAFKKKYQEFTQIVKISTLENGKTSLWDFSLDIDDFVSTYFADYLDLEECDDCWAALPKGLFFESPAYAYEAVGSASDLTVYATKYSLLAYTVAPPSEPSISFSVKDGGVVGFAYATGSICSTTTCSTAPFYIYIDTNGAKKPNTYGFDRFIMQIYSDGLYVYGEGASDLTSNSTYGCSSSGNKMYCGAYILENNWTYPDDYPKS